MWKPLRLLLVFWLFWALVYIVTLLMTGVIFDMAQVFWCLIFVFLHYLNSIDLGGWIASMASPTTTLVFLGSLDLRLISRRRGLGLSLVFGGFIAKLPIDVLFVFFCWRMMTFWALGIDFPNVKGWLQFSFCFYITCFLHHFFPYI